MFAITASQRIYSDSIIGRKPYYAKERKMRCTEVVKILEIMRLSELGISQREIASSVKCGKSTVGDIQQRCREEGLTYAAALEMGGDAIKALLYPSKNVGAVREYPDWESVHKWLKSGKRRNLQYAWEEYRLSKPNGLSYSQYCRLYRTWRDCTGKSVSMVQDHEPGDKAFIDWAGDTLDCVIDPGTGEVHTAHFFVAVLGYSYYPYAEAFPNEQMDNWLTANIHALEWFCGLPRVIVPDNTTTAVTKPHYFDPKLNPTYLDFAQHYGVAIVPARPYKAKDKSPAEGSVGWLETWLLEWLRGQYFFSFDELNRSIKERLKVLSDRPFQKRSGSRASEYEAFDKPALRPLPLTRYEFAHYVTRRVPDSYHVEYAEFYYSVPYVLFGQVVTVRATPTMIEIVNGNRVRVALHYRRYTGKRYVTKTDHMPERHKHYAEFAKRTGKDYLAWAETIGPDTHALVERMLKAQIFEETAYRSCMGVIQFTKKYSPEKLEIACGRALEIGNATYTTVKNLLQNPPLVKRAQPLPVHENLRNPAEFS
jgi:transposase